MNSDKITISKREYTELLNRMDEIKSALMDKQKQSTDVFIDNQEFLQIMNISKTTAHNWRTAGIISFSHIGGKVYYRMSDIQNALDSNYRQAKRKIYQNA